MTLPADRFVSLSDHAAWCAHNQALQRERARVEAAPTDQPREATCGPCLRATVLTGGRCDCPDSLDGAERALLQAAEVEAGLCSWSRLLVLDLAHGSRFRPKLIRRLVDLAGSGRCCTDMTALTAEADVAIAHLPTEGAAEALRFLRAALVAGGCLLARVTLQAGLPRSRPDVFGWDLLEMARAAGFAQATLVRPWSRELGYLGDIHLLKAVA